MYKKTKRILDFITAIILIIPMIFIFFIVGLLIKLDDRGPIFYKAERLGKNGKNFRMFKFRTMKVDAPDIRNRDGSTFNSNDDPRITRIGKLLRETSIDELPQILNVLKGEMSFIGPRASMGDSLDTFKREELDKMKIRPGITGYTQAYYRNSLSMREKRKIDAWYANNYTFKLDFKIIIKTMITIFKKENIYSKEKMKNR